MFLYSSDLNFLSFFLSRPRLGSETFCGWGLFNCSDEMNQQYSLNFHMLWRKLIVLLMNDVYPRDTGSPRAQIRACRKEIWLLSSWVMWR